MRGAELYRRMHFYAGNALRAATIPWKQHRIAPADATTLFGCSYGDAGWHHLRKTLAEYDANPRIDYRETTLYRYLTGFTPGSICDLLPWPQAERRLPLFVYPWGTFRKDETVSPKSAAMSRFCGPSTPEFIADEFARTIRLYETMKRTGYSPWDYPHTFIGGTLLLKSNGERRFVVLQGNHRLAILAHLGLTDIRVRDCAGCLPVVRESDAANWPLVADGTCSADAALGVFNLFFNSTGLHIPELLNASHQAPVEAR